MRAVSYMDRLKVWTRQDKLRTVFASFSVLSSFTLTSHDVTVIKIIGRVIIYTFIMKGKAELQAKSGRSHSMKYEESLPYIILQYVQST
ncbi:hypothetical protein OUZ56_029233 [Daphnia magna]|uniref:Uncharacterized protein n=1 Tax=Daphnia magna TaxID=35525 RepID=A0ABR0B676_9CRUS|nr:hypothetical protein OUZ56_029233 [Daphnia magna]